MTEDEILIQERVEAFELIRKQDDEIVDSGAWQVLSSDAESAVNELSDSALEVAGYEMAQTRRLELFDRLRAAGAGIVDAANKAGVSKSAAHRHEVVKFPSGKFTTVADREAKVRDALEEHPEASNREIAKQTGVSHPTVAAIRKRPAPQLSDVASDDEITASNLADQVINDDQRVNRLVEKHSIQKKVGPAKILFATDIDELASAYQGDEWDDLIRVADMAIRWAEKIKNYKTPTSTPVLRAVK